MQALPDAPESLCITEMGGTEGRGEDEPGIQGNKNVSDVDYDKTTILSIIITPTHVFEVYD